MEVNQELADLVGRFRDAASQQDPGWLQQQLKDLLGREESARPATRPTRRTRPPARLSPQDTGGLRSRARRISASPSRGERTIRSAVPAARIKPTAANTRRRGPGSRQVTKPADHVTQAAGRGRRGRKPAPPAAASASVTEDRHRAVSPSSPPGTSSGPSLRRVCALSPHAASAVEGGGRGKEPAPQTAAAREEQGVGLSSSPHSQIITGPDIVEGWDSPQHMAGGRRGEKHAPKTAAATALRDDQHGELSPSPLPGAATADIDSSPRAPVLMDADRGEQSIPCSPTHSNPSQACSTPSPSTSARRRLSRVRPRTSPPVRKNDFTRPVRPASMSTAGQAQGGRVITAQIHHRESGERRVDTPTGRRGWRQEPTSASRSTVRVSRHGRDPITPTRERSPAPRNRSRSRSRDNSRRVRREHSHSSVRSSRRDVTAHAYSQEARVRRWERSSRSPSRSYSHREGHSCCHFSCRNSPRMSEREASQARSVTSKDGTRRRRSTSHDRVQPVTIRKQPPPKSNRMSSSLTAQGAATASGPGVGAFSGGSAGSSTAAMPISTAALAAGERRLLELVKVSLAKATWTAYGKAWEEWNQLTGWAGGFTTREDRRAGLIWYVVWLTEQGKSAAFIDKRMAGLAFQFKLRGEEDLTKEFIIRQALKGVRKSRHSKDTRRPISFQLLARLQGVLDQCCYSGYEVQLFRAAFALAFFGAFRVGELVSKSKTSQGGLLLQDVKVFQDKITIRLRQSKTDSLGKGKDIVLFKVDGGATCPVGCVSRFLHLRGVCGKVFLQHENGMPLTRFQFNNILKKSLESVGVNPTEFGTHSFRIGAATEAAGLGLGERMVMKIGRWESKRFLSYIRPGLLV
ncbi:serine/arginine repetitive matrix protein 2-like isoform X1 [Xenopus laevis]|uniref:Serine/arginine repetitive matrix protein 2-like isoform X1 n=1 Tax=Xenopus laevis TaxID=8355 RepID=A0A8J1LIN2_XENLA|nr:serine/arginine repetitive matrix protein 2-like isoform X1 [Xenopus laevis]